MAKNDIDGFIFWKNLASILEKAERPMAEKYVKFALSPIVFPESQFRCKTKQNRTFCTLESVRKKGNWIFVKQENVDVFVNNLKEMSVELTYEDVKEVCVKYALTLRRSRKMGMRGNRNFTGKVEDEIRGKLSELGIAKFCEIISGVKFEPDFSVLEKGKLRDEGDFTEIEKEGKKIPLTKELLIAVKSTAGYFSLAVPKNEWDWPGNVYIAVRLHIEESFLLKLLEKSLGLNNFDLSEKIGWVEIFGYIFKKEMEDLAFVGTRLPGKYHSTQNDWNLPNYIMHPLQLHRSKKEFEDLMKLYTKFNG